MFEDDEKRITKASRAQSIRLNKGMNELQLAKDIKEKMKSFHSYTVKKRKAPLLCGGTEQITGDKILKNQMSSSVQKQANLRNN